MMRKITKQRDIAIRRSTWRDIPGIMGMIRANAYESMVKTSMLSQLSTAITGVRNELTFCALDGNNPVGMVTVSMKKRAFGFRAIGADEPKTLAGHHLYNGYVKPSYRRKCIMKKLTEHALNTGEGKALYWVSENPKSFKLATNCGWSHLGQNTHVHIGEMKYIETGEGHDLFHVGGNI
jgi:hypothetical protein